MLVDTPDRTRFQSRAVTPTGAPVPLEALGEARSVTALIESWPDPVLWRFLPVSAPEAAPVFERLS
ncbi:MAG: hypothetical protein ACFE0O_00615 [Opitutales bacterium]